MTDLSRSNVQTKKVGFLWNFRLFSGVATLIFLIQEQIARCIKLRKISQILNPKEKPYPILVPVLIFGIMFTGRS